MDNVTHNRDGDVSLLCEGLKLLDLPRITIDKHHPVFRLLLIPTQGFSKEIGNHRLGSDRFCL